MKNLGITKVVRKSKTRIERTTADGSFVVERDEGILIPLPAFIGSWMALKSAIAEELFANENGFEIEELTSAEFVVSPNDDDFKDICITSVVCKGTLLAGRRAEFSNASFYDEKTLEIAEDLYKAAADYFDGKNAQTEFEFKAEAKEAK